jgi:hypothetical protein
LHEPDGTACAGRNTIPVTASMAASLNM